MVDIDLIMAKAGSVEKHLRRIRLKTDMDLRAFMNDVDTQESILFNMQMAIQNCIDMAAHIISDEGLGVPGSTNEMFYLLEDNGFLDRDLTEKMAKAVGFRNLMVHEYGKIEMEQVFEMARKDIDDLNDYLKSIFHKLGVM
ncbi:MAG: DUF86 domain-containing protein [Thermodesulfobacteriota bacterium]|nr:DUF86 domain-containing protein [Thermodesulfobacteriota bacterium]